MTAEHETPAGEPEAQDEIVVGLLTDPDLPAALADHLGAVLPDELGERCGTGRTWRVEVVQDPFESMYPDYRNLVDKARHHVHGTRWDISVCITDLPTRRGSDVVVATIDEQDRVAVVSLPSLGGVFLRRKLRALVVSIVEHLAARGHDGSAATAAMRAALSSNAGRLVRPAPDDTTVDVVRQGRLATPRLVAGMVRANRPWQMVLGLSTALAGAMTGVAFGVLYSSIWALATSLSIPRLVAITVGAISAMAVWLVAGHHLWDDGNGSMGTRPPEVRLRNASTVTTVVAGTTIFFLALFAIAVMTVFVVVPPSYLAENVGSASPRSYLTIALMATVLGTIAGAVGSGLEDDTTVRRATYGYREHERRQRAEHETDNHTTPIRQFRRD
ncbi:hypothetical protein [Actinophytocola glycyrrhizae]|uniref:Uncharacterized protein n=1 Tax=Actinophytocola glycyrrhizae TaxID=2044873 RepID=A0ABV9RTW0_9PSEU